MLVYFIAIISVLFAYATAQDINSTLLINSSDYEDHEKHEVLSRRKRFIIFPEGSSIQLVFCLTFPSINVISDIILFGYTAALAYELPQDPYSPFNHHADPLHRRVDSKEIYYLNEAGRIIYKRPYRTKLIVNPAFAKRSVESQNEDSKFKIDRQLMHASKLKREFLKSEHMDERSAQFHRSSRSLLYRKIETMLQGLGGNGRQCLLKTLCQIGQTQEHPQGSFFQEILRAVFTMPKSHTPDPHPDHQVYDAAHGSTKSCDLLYPECDPIQDLPSNVATY